MRNRFPKLVHTCQVSPAILAAALRLRGFQPWSSSCNENDCHHHHHHHLSLNREGRWGIIDDFTTSFLHFSLFSTALWDLANCRPVHSLMLSSHVFLSLSALSSSPFHCALLTAAEKVNLTWDSPHRKPYALAPTVWPRARRTPIITMSTASDRCGALQVYFIQDNPLTDGRRLWVRNYALAKLKLENMHLTVSPCAARC